MVKKFHPKNKISLKVLIDKASAVDVTTQSEPLLKGLKIFSPFFIAAIIAVEKKAKQSLPIQQFQAFSSATLSVLRNDFCHSFLKILLVSLLQKAMCKFKDLEI